MILSRKIENRTLEKQSDKKKKDSLAEDDLTKMHSREQPIFPLGKSFGVYNILRNLEKNQYYRQANTWIS